MLTVQLKRVLIADPVHESCSRILQGAGIETRTRTKMTKQQLVEEIKDYDGVIVRSETKIDEDVLRAGTRLKVVGRAGTGVDNIDTLAATKFGVIVLNAPGGNSISACELTCALIMNLARDIGGACGSLKSGAWERKRWAGSELKGKTLAVLGLGRVGREVASRMASFGTTLLGYDPYPPPLSALPHGMQLLPLDEIWPRADYITLHVPLLPQTKGLLGHEELMRRCKEGVRVVNCSRGGVVDEGALLEAVESRGVRAGLDVFTEEPPRSQQLLKLISHPNVIATPHLGASTEEAQQRVAAEIAEQFIGLSQPSSGFKVEGAVNFPGLRELLGGGAWAWVGRALGGLGRALWAPEHGEGELRGPASLSSPTLLGLLSGWGGGSSNGLNLVSAPSVAASKGVRLTAGPPTDDGVAALSVPGRHGESHVVRGTVKDGEGFLLSVDEAVFSPGARLSQNTMFFRISDAQKECPHLIGEIMRKGVLIKNMAMAEGKTVSWLALEASQPLSSLNVQDLKGVIV